MKSRLLRIVLTYLAPIIITYVVKKFEERSAAKKAQQTPTAQN